jgi:hypothetical protein
MCWGASEGSLRNIEVICDEALSQKTKHPKRPGQTETSCSNSLHALSSLYSPFRLHSRREKANPMESYSCACARSKANRITSLQKNRGVGCTPQVPLHISPSAAQVPQNVHLHKNGRGYRRVAAALNPQGPDRNRRAPWATKARRRGEERFFGRRGDLRMIGRPLLVVGVGADDIDQEGNAVWLCQLNATRQEADAEQAGG